MTPGASTYVSCNSNVNRRPDQKRFGCGKMQGQTDQIQSDLIQSQMTSGANTNVSRNTNFDRKKGQKGLA